MKSVGPTSPHGLTDPRTKRSFTCPIESVGRPMSSARLAASPSLQDSGCGKRTCVIVMPMTQLFASDNGDCGDRGPPGRRSAAVDDQHVAMELYEVGAAECGSPLRRSDPRWLTTQGSTAPIVRSPRTVGFPWQTTGSTDMRFGWRNFVTRRCRTRSAKERCSCGCSCGCSSCAVAVQFASILSTGDATEQAADQREHAPGRRETTHSSERVLARSAPGLSVSSPLIICPLTSNEWASAEATSR